MNDSVNIWEKPKAEQIYMLAGWEQWADGGSVSSGLPQYLISHLRARKIGELRPDGFYLFQIPGMHHLLRPQVKFEDGHSKTIKASENSLYYTGDEQKGIVIFTGEEPNMDIDRYADALFSAAKQLSVQRIVAVGGVYGAMPYEKDREVSCTYSLPTMKDELRKYAVRFSNYEGGATIGSYLVNRAQQAAVEMLVFNAFVPAYDFSQAGLSLQGLRIEEDYRAWYELMKRITYMFQFELDLADLDSQSEALVISMHKKLEELSVKMPQLNVQEYLATLSSEFKENSFAPLDELWERELGDLFDGDE